MSPQTKESRWSPSVGMLGAGFMARTHTTAARLAGARLDVLASSRPERAEIAAAELGYARASVPEHLLTEALDVVHVCTPNTSHTAYARAALLAGSHVICEKPLATSADEARELVALAEQQQRVAAVPFVYRYHPMVREARARIASGEAGAVLTISGRYLQDWLLGAGDDNWRVAADAGGPSRAFADIGSHLVDLLEFVSGDRITRLVATTRTVHAERGGQPVDTEDAVALTIELAGGGIGSLLISQVAPGRKNALVLEIAGADESVRFAQEDPETLSADAARLSNVPAGHAQGYQDAFNGFIADAYAAVAGETPEGLPTFRDGLRAAIITDAVLESARSGAWVEVSAE